jgi:hypothetical protein
MGCAEDYNDEKERLQTHPMMLPKAEGPVNPKTVMGTITAQNHDQVGDRRSGLDKVCKSVTWNTSLNRVEKNNEKGKKCHLELVVARALRAREANRTLVRGLE